MSGPAIVDRPSPNHDARPADGPIDMLVLHYTGMQSAQAALERLTDPAAKVSAHYCIDEDGTVFRLVDEARRAWHAGLSHWRGLADINARSIGIELVNPGHEWGYRAFPPAQIDALVGLAQDILARNLSIEPRHIVGHSDIAPTRKTDPGELFPWHALAVAGIGLWPEELPAPPAALIDRGQAAHLLATIGYDCADFAAALTAFQRRFHQQRVDGTLDQPAMARLATVARRYSNG